MGGQEGSRESSRQRQRDGGAGGERAKGKRKSGIQSAWESRRQTPRGKACEKYCAYVEGIHFTCFKKQKAMATVISHGDAPCLLSGLRGELEERK